MNCTKKFDQRIGSNITCCYNVTQTGKYNCTTVDVTKMEWPPQPYNDIYVSLMIIVTLLVVFGNGFVLYKLLPFTRHRRISNIELLIIYLSVFDLATVLFLTADIYENYVGYGKWPFGWFGCKLMYPSFNISLGMSVCVLIIMSVDRCRSIRTPLKKKFSQRSIHIAVFLAFVISVSLNWYQFKGHFLKGTLCYVARGDPEYLEAKVVVTSIRDAVFLITFTATTYLISQSLKFNDILATNPSRKTDVILMLITMETVFAMLVVPYDAYDIAMMASRLPGNTPIMFTENIWHLDRILSILQMSNSFANCFIYAKMHKYVTVNRHNTSSTSTFIDSRKGSRQTSQQELSGNGNPCYATSVFM